MMRNRFRLGYAFFLCWLVGAFAGMNSTLFSVVQKQAMETMGADVATWGSAIIALFLIGWMVGGMVIGRLADRWGRVRAMALSVALYSLAAALASGVDSVWTFALCRFITALGVGGAMATIGVYLSEIWSGRSRAVAIGALITSYQLGVFLSGFVTAIVPSWRAAFLLAGASVALCPLLLMGLREAKRVKKERSHTTSSLRRPLLLGSLGFGALLVAYWAAAVWVPTWIQTLPGAGPKSHIYAVIAHGMMAVVGCSVAGLLADRWGRTRLLAVSFALALATSIWLFGTTTDFGVSVYMGYGLLGFAIGLLQAVMYIYLPELFPASSRATAVGICLNSGRIVTAGAVLAVGPLIALFGSYSHILLAFSSVYAVGIVVALMSKETLHVKI